MRNSGKKHRVVVMAVPKGLGFVKMVLEFYE